jgi:hypothetical protein
MGRISLHYGSMRVEIKTTAVVNGVACKLKNLLCLLCI